jgi:hypothetical protein
MPRTANVWTIEALQGWIVAFAIPEGILSGNAKWSKQ